MRRPLMFAAAAVMLFGGTQFVTTANAESSDMLGAPQQEGLCKVITDQERGTGYWKPCDQQPSAQGQTRRSKKN
jgi:hypothetical protein